MASMILCAFGSSYPSGSRLADEQSLWPSLQSLHLFDFLSRPPCEGATMNASWIGDVEMVIYREIAFHDWVDHKDALLIRTKADWFSEVSFSGFQQFQRDLIDVDLTTGRRVPCNSHHEKRISTHFTNFDLQIKSDFHHLIIRQG